MFASERRSQLAGGKCHLCIPEMGSQIVAPLSKLNSDNLMHIVQYSS